MLKTQGNSTRGVITENLIAAGMALLLIFCLGERFGLPTGRCALDSRRARHSPHFKQWCGS